jgi:hypothetical protein
MNGSSQTQPNTPRIELHPPHIYTRSKNPMTTSQARVLGFAIIAYGHKFCFIDTRNGYTSPPLHETTMWDKLDDYIAKHRAHTCFRSTPDYLTWRAQA